MSHTLGDPVQLDRSTIDYFSRHPERAARLGKKIPDQICLQATHAVAHMGPDSAILDIGCGSGQAYPMIQKWGGRYVGIDPAAGQIHAARTKYPHLDFRVGGLQDLPSLVGLEKQFDGFVASFVIPYIPRDHLGDQVKMLTSIMKSGGVGLVTYYPGDDDILITDELTIGFPDPMPAGERVLITLWRAQKLIPLFQRAGFEIRDQGTCGNIAYLIVQAQA